MCQDSCLELEHAEREPFLLRFDAVENDLSELKILKICCDFDAFAMNKDDTHKSRRVHNLKLLPREKKEKKLLLS